MGYVGGNIGDFPVLAIDLCSKGGALAHFQSQGDLKKHTNNSYSEVPHGRGISENGLSIPFKSPPLPVRGVVGTDIDRCIMLSIIIFHVCNGQDLYLQYIRYL